MAHKGLPKPGPLVITKAELIDALARLDQDQKASSRALVMETDFRDRDHQPRGEPTNSER